MRWLALAVALILWASSARAQGTCDAGSTCVPAADLKAFVQLLKDQKCRAEKTPTLTASQLVIVVDRQGRVYYSGNDPQPYKLHIDWCNYQIDVEAKIQLQVAQRVEPTWGFRFRPKAAFGLLAVEAYEDGWSKGLDGGLLLEPFYVKWVNVNAYVGVRSAGGAVGLDITKNFGVALGYATSWGKWRSNPFTSVYFAF
jgi:hypothetical protein